jgi:hypothetical protein
MGKSNPKSGIKTKITNDIKSGLVKELNALTGKFGERSPKLQKAINKGAKKLAKKIAKRIQIAEPAANGEPKKTAAAKSPVTKAKAPVVKALPKTVASKRKA